MPAVRIAMWSGPRNISTAMLRSFGSRDDTTVTDEPLYASYLARTGLTHPGRDEILASQSHNADDVFAMLLGDVPKGKSIWYQKHMAHHLPDEIERVPVSQMRHAFLIRDPAEMLTSFRKIIDSPTAEQVGLPQQLSLFRRVRELSGTTPPVIDSRDVLEDPEGQLRQLCDRLEIPFQDAMLSWAAGERETDGVWASHWYGNVIKSTSFAPYRPKDEVVPDTLLGVLDQCQEIYDELFKFRLR